MDKLIIPWDEVLEKCIPWHEMELTTEEEED
jgi:hypothetical protein